MNLNNRPWGVIFHAKVGAPLTAKQCRVWFSANVSLTGTPTEMSIDGNDPTGAVQEGPNILLLTYTNDVDDPSLQLSDGPSPEVDMGPNIVRMPNNLQLDTADYPPP